MRGLMTGGRRWVMLLLAAALAAGAALQGTVVSATSCTGKCVLAAVSPSSLPAGSTSVAVLSLTNEANPQSLGSADLRASGGFILPLGQPTPTVVTPAGSGPGSASISSDGTTLQVRNLNLAAGATARISFEVTAPCAATSTMWGLVVKQANNFSGQPGNDFINDPASSLTLSATGSCMLAFSAEPTNAVVNTDITAQGFQPASPPATPVTVSATDSHGNAVAGVTVGLSLLPTGGAAVLSGTTSAVTGMTGSATFSPLSIDLTGYYQLRASASGFTSVNSTPFQITSTVQKCTSDPCSTSSGGKYDSASSTAINEGSGDLLSVGIGGFVYSCNGYTAVSDVVGTDVWQPNGVSIDPAASGQVTIVISKHLVTLSPNNGAPFYEICYASTDPFTTRSGGISPSTTAQGGVTLYYGLLPDCGKVPVAPCVLSRNKTGAGAVVISFLGTGDFWGQG
jgi:hypothetical protein